ncbi:DNA-directed RNA polymerase I core subunit RPA135 [Sugiyamaella lignohabitans]|uniref:DNA-directed RNA polymerase I core subunit RPA135 n=1 Tax=Sugiyamaella lignohabitans TaxID=796027 RepID=A0A167G059_9ASCO|nr:DNA-directed RNA polymerase I core subunit RPA135 [Sugiyamaella lignohabitans]ANB15929.1 DNA-directed RNA polymerase I core subunit RPA135 [Sugiyamaella lignohabitans]
MGVSFHTLEREKIFRDPPTDKPSYPLLAQAIQPHVGSFNALMEGPGDGLLNLAVKDIGSKIVFDSNDPDRLGNKLSCKSMEIGYILGENTSNIL